MTRSTLQTGSKPSSQKDVPMNPIGFGSDHTSSSPSNTSIVAENAASVRNVVSIPISSPATHLQRGDWRRPVGKVSIRWNTGKISSTHEAPVIQIASQSTTFMVCGGGSRPISHNDARPTKGARPGIKSSHPITFPALLETIRAPEIAKAAATIDPPIKDQADWPGSDRLRPVLSR